MKRLVLVFTIALAMSACGKKEAAMPAATKQAPPLPADVQSVSGTAAPDASPTTTSTRAATQAALMASVSETVPVASAQGDTIVATGEFVSPTRSELAPKIAGRVARMFVDEGSRVSKGQPVLELDSEYTRLNLQRAEADVARAKAAADDARRDLDRKKELIAKDSIPRATFDRSQSTFDQAEAALQSAAAQAALLRQQLSDSVLRSPIDGVVAEKRTDVGQRVGEATVQVAVVIAQTSPLKLRFRVPERYLAAVHRGDPVRATVDPYPNEVFEGKVTVVGGVIDTASRAMLVESEFPNRDGRLRPGLFARVEMKTK